MQTAAGMENTRRFPHLLESDDSQFAQARGAISTVRDPLSQTVKDQLALFTQARGSLAKTHQHRKVRKIPKNSFATPWLISETTPSTGFARG